MRHEGQYCWQDPEGKRHHRVKTHHLKGIVKYVEQGGVLEMHDDVPDSVREQLYDEENQPLDKKKAVDNSPMGSVCPPINNNFLPAGSFQQPMHIPAGDSISTTPGCTESIMVDCLLDVAVEEYSEWQQSQVSNETFRENITRAPNVTVEDCFDLMQICEDQDSSFFVKHGVKVGAARRFVRELMVHKTEAIEIFLIV
jgi:hypothetical protein